MSPPKQIFASRPIAVYINYAVVAFPTKCGDRFMAITWILVANASLARLYANLGPNRGSSS